MTSPCSLVVSGSAVDEIRYPSDSNMVDWSSLFPPMARRYGRDWLATCCGGIHFLLIRLRTSMATMVFVRKELV